MEDGQRLADSQSIAFMETSAKSNVNISEAFSTMAQIILEKVRARGREGRGGEGKGREGRGGEGRGGEERRGGVLYSDDTCRDLRLVTVVVSLSCWFVVAFVLCVSKRETAEVCLCVVCRTQRCSKAPSSDQQPVIQERSQAQIQKGQSAARVARQPF